MRSDVSSHSRDLLRSAVNTAPAASVNSHRRLLVPLQYETLCQRITAAGELCMPQIRFFPRRSVNQLTRSSQNAPKIRDGRS
jgi:hypothetical protein